MINITFLGTGSAVPTAKRNHVAMLLKYKAETMLFDCGEGTQRQFRKAKINPCKLTKLFITHWHGDHILGIPGLLQTLQLNNYNKTLEVYGPKGTKKFMDKMLKLFVHEGKIKFKVKEISRGKIVEDNDFKVEATPVKHNTPCLAYNFIEKSKLRIDKNKLKKLKLGKNPLLKKLKQGKDIVVDGKKVKYKSLTYGQAEKKISFVVDTVMIEDIAKFVKNADLFICESTYLDESDLAKQYLHLTVSQSAQIAKKAKVKKLVLLHLSQRHEMHEKDFLVSAKKIFKNSVIVNDLDSFEV